MKNTILAMLGAAALSSAALYGKANAQIVGEPCETCGVALGAPLPEGVYFVDNESYGQREGQSNRLGVNVPITAWSTPFSFYDTRLEVFAAIPVFTHIDGATINRVDVYSQALLFVFAHDFGNGFNAAIIAGPRGADNFTNQGRGAIADLRASISYVKDGYNATVTANYGGNFGGKITSGGNIAPGTFVGFDDNIFIDYTFTKKFGKLEAGVIGYYETDLNGPVVRQRALAVGGLVGYDFGKFTLQLYATREVYVRNGGWGLGQPVLGQTTQTITRANSDYDTRGYVRIIVPLYVAPAPAAPVVAKY